MLPTTRFDFAVNKGKSLDDKIDNLADAAEDLIKKGISEMDVKNFVRDQVKEIGRDIKKEVLDEIEKKVFDKIEDTAKKGFEEVEETVTKKIPDIVAEEIPEKIKDELEEALQSLAQAITKEGLKKVRDVIATTDKELSKLASNRPDLVDSIDSLSLSIEIGPLTLSYSDFYSRIDDISEVMDKYANNPPKLSRKAINQMVLALGPTSVDFGLSIQAALFVVASNEIGVGVSVGDIPLKLFTEIGDIVMEKIGVPE